MFLTKNELRDLTSYKFREKQIQWLRDRGYKHEISANGQPKVLKSYIESILGLNNQKYDKSSSPDFSALV